MHPVYGDKCFAKPTVQVWRKKMLGGQKFASVPRCNQSFVSGLDSSVNRSLHWAFRNLLPDGTKCLNILGWYVEK